MRRVVIGSIRGIIGGTWLNRHQKHGDKRTSSRSFIKIRITRQIGQKSRLQKTKQVSDPGPTVSKEREEQGHRQNSAYLMAVL